MSNPLKSAAQAVGAAAQGALNAAYGPTVMTKVAQGATEISNALFSGSPAYSPVTADKAADNAHRAQFQQRGQSRGMER
jgi:hypothetical protein